MKQARPSFKPYSTTDFLPVRDFLVESFSRFRGPANWLIDRWNFVSTVGRTFNGLSAGDWALGIGLWVDAEGGIQAMVNEEEGKGDVFLQFASPFVADPGLVNDMLDFAERTCVRGLHDGDRGFNLRVPKEIISIASIIEARGYAPHGPSEPLSERSLAVAPEIPALPGGYTYADANSVTPAMRADAHRRAFGYSVTDVPENVGIPAMAAARKAPDWRPDLDISILGPGGEEVSFACVWLDARNALAVLEPVGTDAAHRRKGLAEAAIALGLSRAHASGARRAFVGSDLPFYRALGFEAQWGWEVFKYRVG